MSNLPDPFYLIFGLGAVALVPFIAVMTTSFVKIAVVIGLLRNALGIQQIPPNMAIHGLALILTAYIMAPVGIKTYNELSDKNISFENTEELKTVISSSAKPYQEFLMANGKENEQTFFYETAKDIWPEEVSESLEENVCV
jgi:type III secretion protein R